MERSRLQFTQYLHRLPTWQLAIGSTFILIGIWIIDYFITVNLGMSIFYVLPISIMTWYLSVRIGYSISLISAFLWCVAEVRRLPADSNLLYLAWNTSARLAFFTIVVFLLAELKLAYRQEQFLARNDSLTAILNRRAFIEVLEQEIERSHRFMSPFTLIYLDVDNFKYVNDSLGHAIGDKLLQDIAIICRQQLRSIDYQARLGGDEFAILMPQTNPQQATAAIDRLLEQLSILKSHECSIGFSLGALFVTTTIPNTAHQALSAADRLMYVAKANGKDQVVRATYADDPEM